MAMRNARPGRWLLAAALLACGGRLAADDEFQKFIYFKVGDPAPGMELKDDEGNVWKSSHHYGKKYVVLYFYPADFGKADAVQACAYRDLYGQLTAQGAEVIGVSGDCAKAHQLFRDKYRLKQTLLVDDQGEAGKAFGLYWSGGGDWTYKGDDGKEVQMTRGITESRWTWVLGRDGVVLYKNTSPKPEDDARDVLKFLTDLNARPARP
jgi:peroxiredoxin Q/BCP